MKASFLPFALMALLASVTLSAGAKPNAIQWSQAAQSGDRQNSSILVAAGTATTAVSGRRDRPISPARPRP